MTLGAQQARVLEAWDELHAALVVKRQRLVSCAAALADVSDERQPGGLHALALRVLAGRTMLDREPLEGRA